EKHRASQALAHRTQAQAKLFPLPEAAPTPLDVAALKQGQEQLQNVRVQAANLAARIDAIERVDVASSLRDFSYRPIQHVREANPPVISRLLLAYRSILLGEIQSTLPSSGTMVCGPNLERRQVKLDALQGKVREVLKELAAHMDGTKEAPLVLNSHCAV